MGIGKGLRSFWERLRGGRQMRFYMGRASSNFAGAGAGRLTADWAISPLLSADREIRYELLPLRARARELVRNNSYASRYVSLLEENVVGPLGIKLQAEVKGPDGLAIRPVNEELERAWKRWGRPEFTTAEGRMSWLEVEQLLIRSLPPDGEFLVRLLPGFRNEFGFAVQVLDPDQLDVTLNRAPEKNRNEIRMGIEIDQWGRPLRYYLLPRHPLDIHGPGKVGIDDMLRLPASEVVHGFVPRRPGQSRGVPWFAAIMWELNMARGYQEAELVGARLGASNTGLFLRDPEAAPDPDAEEPEEQVELPLEASPASFYEIPAGYRFEQFTPQHPNGAFGDFIRQILHGIASGLDVSYASLTGDLKEVNYSSIRAGMLQERDFYRRMQAWMIGNVHRRVYEAWLPWALTTGALELPLAEVERWKQVRFQPRGWDWVDPLKELAAAELELSLGLTSRKRLAGERGRDVEEVLRELAAEQDLIASLGLSLGEASAATALNEKENEGGRAALVRRLLTDLYHSNGKG